MFPTQPAQTFKYNKRANENSKNNKSMLWAKSTGNFLISNLNNCGEFLIGVSLTRFDFSCFAVFFLLGASEREKLHNKLFWHSVLLISHTKMNAVFCFRISFRLSSAATGTQTQKHRRTHTKGEQQNKRRLFPWWIWQVESNKLIQLEAAKIAKL